MTTVAALLLTIVAIAAVAYPLVQRSAAARLRGRGDDPNELEERYQSALADLQDVEADWEIGNLSLDDYTVLRDEHRLRAAETLRQIAAWQAQRERVRRELLRLAGEPNVGRPGVRDQRSGASSEVGEGGPAGGPSDPGIGPPRSNGAIVESVAKGSASPPEPIAEEHHVGPVFDPRRLHDDPRIGPRPFESRGPARELRLAHRSSVRRLTPVVAGAVAAVIAVVGIVALYTRSVGIQAAQQPLASLPIGHAHTVVLDRAGEYWVGHHDGLLRSVDGRTWRATPVRGDVMAVVGEEPNRLLAFGHDVVLESTDGGATWSEAQHDLPGSDVHGAQRGAAGIYAYAEGVGTFRSADGRRWVQTGDPVAQGVGALAVLPAGGADTLFLAAGGTVIRSPDGGRTWAAAAGAVNLALAGAVRSLAAEPSRGVLYAATTEGLFRSSSRGADWTKLPFRGSLAAVGVLGDQVAVVDDRGQFFLSRDGGGKWVAEP